MRELGQWPPAVRVLIVGWIACMVLYGWCGLAFSPGVLLQRIEALEQRVRALEARR